MYSLNINDTKIIDNLEMYMLNSTRNNSSEKISKENTQVEKKTKQFIPPAKDL